MSIRPALERVLQPRLEDREWFSRHPRALVRFRPSREHENFALSAAGLSRPTLVPVGLHCTEAPTWVAVVELSRALGLPDVSDGVSVRVRCLHSSHS